MRTLTSLLLSLALCGGLLPSCNRGSEVENELTSAGRLYLADGKPAVNARVRFYAIDHVPGDGTASVEYETRTDSKGRYGVDSVSLPKGEYNILGELGEASSYEDSVFIRPGDGARLPDDTLLAAGTVVGLVGLQPGDDPRTVTVQALGTNRFTNVDEEGRFTLAGLAEGTYTVRLVTTLAEYTPTFASLTARAGRRDSLEDTLKLIYTGIPVVTGLAATYDTAKGVVRLAWNRSRYAKVADYLVYRSDAEILQPQELLIARTADTVAWDTLHRLPNDPWRWPSGGPSRSEYRVRIRALDGSMGGGLGSVQVATPSPESVRTTLALRYAEGGADTISVNDTLRIAVTYSNPGRESRLARWRVDGKIVREAQVEGKTGSDTLAFVPSEAGSFAISAAVTDVGGQEWNIGLRIMVVALPPVADAGLYAFVRAGDTLRLVGKSISKYSRVRTFEWDVGATGEFVPAPGGRLDIPAPSLYGMITCILRVTDEDGLSDRDTLRVYVNPLKTLAQLPMYPNPLPWNRSALSGRLLAIEAREHLYVFGGATNLVQYPTYLSYHDVRGFAEYDPVADVWIQRSIENPQSGDMRAPIVTGNRIYSIQVQQFQEYLLETHAWERRAFHPSLATLSSEGTLKNWIVIGAAGGIFVFGERGRPATSPVFEYEPATNRWIQRPNLTPSDRSDFSLQTHGRKIFTAHWGERDGSRLPIMDFWEYHVDANRWARRADRPTNGVPKPMGSLGHNLYYLDGTTRDVQIYDTATATWSVKSSHPGAFPAITAPEEGPLILQREGRFLSFQKTGEAIQVHEYDPSADRWTELPGILTPSNSFEAVVVKGKVYLILTWTSIGIPEHLPVLFEYSP